MSRAGSHLTLARYVRARNGIALGASGSLGNMLRRSLGASSFAGFWRHWNPIWGYGLGRWVFRPARRALPPALALVLTFVVSGLVHDLVIMGLRRSFALIFTPWFFLVSLGVVAGEALGMDLGRQPWVTRAAVHLAFLGSCLWLTLQLGGLSGPTA